MRNKHKKYMKNTQKKGDIFPLWALFVALGCIGATGLFLNSRLTNVKKTETADYSFSL